MTIRSRTIPVSAIAAAVCASLVASSAWAGTGQKTSGTHECHGSAVDPKGDCLAHGDPGALLKLTDASLYDLANAMKPAQGRPNELSRIAGQMAYLRQDYAAAITQFERGAHYADKYSQHILSLMHWHGIGVDRDPVQGYIWADLAAERGSNVMLLIREKMWSGLTPVQQELAVASGREFHARFGDHVAKPRAEGAMRRFASQMTGSRVGFDGYPLGLMGAPNAGTYAPQVGSPASFYANSAVATTQQLYEGDRRDIDAYWATQDRVLDGGKVEVGPVAPVRDRRP